MSDPHDFTPEVYRYGSSDITVEHRGGNLWAVCQSGSVYAEDGLWEHEPMPSSRDAAFISRTRYSKTDAFAVARSAFKADAAKK